MRIIIAAVGKLKSGPETELAGRYAKRATQTGRALGLKAVEVIEIRESRADEAAKRMLEESIALTTIIPPGATVVLLDVKGENRDSDQLAAQLSAWRANDVPAVVFIIGGAQIYQEALPVAQRIVATEIQADIEGDASFAPLDKTAWQEISRSPQTPENGLAYDLVEYHRLKGQS